MRKIRLNSFLQPPQLRLSRLLCLSMVGLSLLAVSTPRASAATVIREALFIYNNAANAALQAGDIVVSNRLVQLGFRINTIDGLTFNAFTVAQATNAAQTNDIVVVSSSVDSGQVGNKLLTVTNGVLNYEGSLFDDFRFSNAAGAVQGNQTNLTVVNPFTPLAAGFAAGAVRVANSGGNFTFFALNDLNDNTAIQVAVGRDPDSNSRQAYVGYEKNALLRDGTSRAAGRRVGFFFEQGNNTFVPQFVTNITFATNMSVITTNVAITTNAGLSFFDAAVNWLTSPPDFTSPVAIPQGPADTVGTELLTASFSAIVTGAHLNGTYAYQWQRTNNVDGWTNVPGATNRRLTTDPLTLADNGAFFRLTVSNGFSSATSPAARLTVNADVAKPTLASAAGFSGSTNTIRVTFSEPVTEASASVASNYLIIDSTNGDVSQVASAGLFGDTRTVVLRTTAVLVPGRAYSVIVSGVTDRAVAGNVINVFSDVQLTVPTLPTMVVELYTGMGGNAWTDLVRFSKFLDHTPDVVSVSNTYFGFNTNLSDSGLNDYGGRIYSYFVAPSNGTYVFYVKGDDGVRLAMNTNSVGSTNPAGAFIIASTNAFFDVNYRADSSKSLPVTLTSNQLYYIEALWKEGGGGDGIGVTFRAAADPTVPPNGEIALASSFRLPGDLLGSSPIGAITVGTVPASQNVNEGQSAAFSVDNVNGAYPRTFQWQRSDGSGGFTNIPGATSTSFQIAVAQAGHNGAQFRLVASNPFSSVTTAPPATLTVSPDVVAPLLASAGTFDGINIGIKFTEQTALDPSVATNINQYIVDGGPTVTNPLGIVSARLLPNGNSVVLTLSNVVTTNAFTVTVLSTKDTSPQANVGGVQNVIGRYPTNTTSILWPGTPQPGSAVAFGDGATYEITAGGNDIWGTQDQGRYVYQSRAGDFDARVKVDSLSIPANGESPSIAKAGLMLRVTAESNSPTLHILANPPSPGRNQQEGGARTAVGGNTDDWIPAPADLRNRPALTNGAPNFNVRNTPVNIPNGWVRITRIGNQFTGYRSFDGVNWAPFTTINLAAPATVLVGLAACAHNPAATNVANGPVTVATFSSFNVGIVQHVPTAVADTLGAVAGVETLVTVSKLLSNDSDQDGDSIAMTAVSSTSVRGGTVRFVTNNAIVSVSYRLNTNANFNVPDSFTYTIRDSAGLTSVGTVNVTITSPGAQTQNLISATPLAGGVVAVQFRGIIGVNYNIQASSDLVTWATIGQATPNALGLITFLDTTAGTAVQRFYRTQVPAP